MWDHESVRKKSNNARRRKKKKKIKMTLQGREDKEWKLGWMVLARVSWPSDVKSRLAWKQARTFCRLPFIFFFFYSYENCLCFFLSCSNFTNLVHSTPERIYFIRFLIHSLTCILCILQKPTSFWHTTKPAVKSFGLHVHSTEIFF